MESEGKLEKVVDTNVDGKMFRFQIGAGTHDCNYNNPLCVGKVISGWEEGVSGMVKGGKRLVVIPPELGYGLHGKPPVIPGNATLLYEVLLQRCQLNDTWSHFEGRTSTN